MNILACADTNYIMPCGVLLQSCLENNPDEKLHFHIIVDESVTVEQREELADIVEKKQSVVSFYSFSSSYLSDFNISGGHLTLATYYRLFITDILSEGIDRILYLDCDMIVRHSLRRLYDMPLDGKAVGAVPDLSEALSERYERLGYPQHLGYFNAGMLLINLSFWRENKLKDVFLDYMRNNREKLLQHDQDVLNFTCRNLKEVLPLKYNSQDGFLYYRMYFDAEKYKSQLVEATNDPVIIHYTAGKPWEKQCDHPYTNVFLYYRGLTKWKDTPLVDAKHPFTIRQRVVRLLRWIGVIKPRYKKTPELLK